MDKTVTYLVFNNGQSSGEVRFSDGLWHYTNTIGNRSVHSMLHAGATELDITKAISDELRCYDTDIHFISDASLED